MKSKKTYSFVDRAKLKHGDKYDYSLSLFTGVSNKIDIICKKHGVFSQRADSHISGSGCPNCYTESRNPTCENFIEMANEKHGVKYSYGLFISMKRAIDIFCQQHGQFKQVARKHLLGQGCPKCASDMRRLTLDNFLKKSKLVHGDKYDYSGVSYKNHSTKVSIICPSHGVFWQTPNNHITQKKGCHSCSRNISKMESRWLDSMGIDILRQHKIKIGNKYYKLDGYDPLTKTIYEFYGDFWHGNINIYNSDSFNPVSGKKFGDLYQKTIDRENYLKYLGYRVISIWENEFKILENEH